MSDLLLFFFLFLLKYLVYLSFTKIKQEFAFFFSRFNPLLPFILFGEFGFEIAIQITLTNKKKTIRAKVCRAFKLAKNHFCSSLVRLRIQMNIFRYWKIFNKFFVDKRLSFLGVCGCCWFFCARKLNSKFDADIPRCGHKKTTTETEKSKKYNNERKRFLYVSHLDDRSTLSAEWKSVCTMFIGAAQSLISPDRCKHYRRHILSNAMFTVLVIFNHLIHEWKRCYSDIAFNANHNHFNTCFLWIKCGYNNATIEIYGIWTTAPSFERIKQLQCNKLK